MCGRPDCARCIASSRVVFPRSRSAVLPCELSSRPPAACSPPPACRVVQPRRANWRSWRCSPPATATPSSLSVKTFTWMKNWQSFFFFTEILKISRGAHQNPCFVAVIQESVDDEIQIVLLVQRRFADRLEAVELQLVGFIRLFACVKGVTRVDAVWACRKCGHWSILSGPRCSDVKTTKRLVAPPHVPF